MQRDAVAYVKKCDKCQRHANYINMPASSLQAIVAPWPFSQWGLDIVGPLPPATGQRRFLLVATDYYTKWVEAEALVKITAQQVEKFLWINILCRYGVPQAFITDNGSQFASQRVRDFCSEQGIELRFASVAYPQCNGQAESTNKTIVESIKKRLDEKKGRWIEELPQALWAHRTTYKTATGETPYSLAFGTEAMIPAERLYGSARIDMFDEAANEEQRRMGLDLLEEVREESALRNIEYKRQIASYHNQKIRQRDFQVGDQVLKKVLPSQQKNKLCPKWKGPYNVTGVVRKGAYKIAQGDIQKPRTWNANSLRKYHS